MPSLCPSAPARHAPRQPRCSCCPQPNSSPAHPGPPPTCPPAIFCPAFTRLRTLPLLSQWYHGAAQLSASPIDTQRWRFWGGFRRERSLSPLVPSYYLPSLSSCTSTIKSRKAAENHLLYPKLCKSKEPEPLQQFVGRAAHPTGTPRPHGPPHVAPVAPLLPAGTGRGRRVRGTNPPSECVRACVYVCARSGCLAANGAWEAQTGG